MKLAYISSVAALLWQGGETFSPSIFTSHRSTSSSSAIFMLAPDGKNGTDVSVGTETELKVRPEAVTPKFEEGGEMTSVGKDPERDTRSRRPRGRGRRGVPSDNGYGGYGIMDFNAPEFDGPGYRSRYGRAQGRPRRGAGIGAVLALADGMETYIEGAGSRRTFERAEGGYRDDMQVSVRSDEGRPIYAEIDLWDGPNNTGQRVRLYSMDGIVNQFEGTLCGGGTVSVLNTGPLEYPLVASVNSSTPDEDAFNREGSVIIQGRESIRTWTLDEDVEEVIVELESDGSPFLAAVELWNGPGDARQVVEVESQDGYMRPFKMVVDTRESQFYGSSTIHIRNIGPLEFPVVARVLY